MVMCYLHYWRNDDGFVAQDYIACINTHCWRVWFYSDTGEIIHNFMWLGDWEVEYDASDMEDNGC